MVSIALIILLARIKLISIKSKTLSNLLFKIRIKCYKKYFSVVKIKNTDIKSIKEIF